MRKQEPKVLVTAHLLSFAVSGGVAEWLRRSVSKHARYTRVGSSPVIGTTNHKLTVNSAVHPPEVVNRVLRSGSKATSTGHTLITGHIKLKCFIQYKDSKL